MNEMRYDVQVVLEAPISRKEALAPFEGLENVQEIEGWSGGRGKVQSQVLATEKGTGIIALPFDTDLLKLKMIAGEWIKGGEEVVINQQAWELYGHVEIGSEIDLTVGGILWKARLVGVAEQFDLPKIYMDQAAYDARFNPDHLINSLMFLAEDKSFHKVKELKRNIEKALEPLLEPFIRSSSTRE